MPIAFAWVSFQFLKMYLIYLFIFCKKKWKKDARFYVQ
jgi:hypothetical protein